MATVTKGRTFVSGETVTPTKLNELVDLATVTAIQTADISDSQITTAKIADLNVTAGKLANTLDLSSKTVSLASSITNQFVPAGAVMPFAMNSAPSGWLAADGTAVSRTTYATLFAAIGTAHGSGDGSTTFNLPDLRGIFVRGSGSQTISGTTYSGTFAAKQQDELKSHDHQYTRYAQLITRVGGGDNNIWASTVGVQTSSTGGAETRPANIALLYCIKF